MEISTTERRILANIFTHPDNRWNVWPGTLDFLDRPGPLFKGSQELYSHESHFPIVFLAPNSRLNRRRFRRDA